MQRSRENKVGAVKPRPQMRAGIRRVPMQAARAAPVREPERVAPAPEMGGMKKEERPRQTLVGRRWRATQTVVRRAAPIAVVPKAAPAAVPKTAPVAAVAAPAKERVFNVARKRWEEVEKAPAQAAPAKERVFNVARKRWEEVDKSAPVAADKAKCGDSPFPAVAPMDVQQQGMQKEVPTAGEPFDPKACVTAGGPSPMV